MKILSNFDTNLSSELYNNYVKKYWKNNTLILFRNKVYLFLYVIIPALFYFFSISLVYYYLWYSITFDDQFIESVKRSFINLVFIISFIPVFWKLLKRIIDYWMDYTIVTPDDIVHYDQNGFFSRDARTLSTSKLKTITVEKDWLLRSLFNFWNIKFLSEWDNARSWDIHIFYIYDPDNVKYKIREIITDTTDEKTSTEKTDN